MKRGFTLVELSIVLVIIGLIVGGVLVGRDLIAAAEVRAQISQIEKYRTAVNTFRIKYGGIPGDITAIAITPFGFTVGQYCDSAEQGSRDGNGLIDATINTKQLGQAFGETGLFWVDISAANMIDGTYTNGAANSMGCGKNNNTVNWSRSPGAPSGAEVGYYLPPAKIGSANYVYVYEVNGYNWFGVAGVTGINGSSALLASPTIPVIQAYNLDAKIDDSLPTTGTVRAVYVNNSVGNTSAAPNAGSDTSSTCYNTSPAYSTSINGGAGLNCALSFRF